jgi:hypothetical protein
MVPMRTLLAVAFVAAAAVAGCGGSDEKEQGPVVSDDQRSILGTLDALQAASRRDDAGKICKELFTESLAKSIADASEHSCEREVRDTLTDPDARLTVGRAIKIEGSRATATVREQNGKTSKLTFVKDGERWRIERMEPVKS